MRARTGTVGLLLVGSGFCALVYQIGWLREFRLIFGASTAASAAVLAIFIGGLGLGSLILGPRADRQSRPLLFYSNLEATIAVCAALSPLLLSLVRTAYIASGGAARLGMPVATIGRLALSALVLAVPTLAMVGKPSAVEALPTDRLVAALTLSTRADFGTMCHVPIAALEPYLVWNEQFLRLRLDCYRLTNDSRLNAASRDVNDFLAREPQPVVVR